MHIVFINMSTIEPLILQFSQPFCCSATTKTIRKQEQQTFSFMVHGCECQGHNMQGDVRTPTYQWMVRLQDNLTPWSLS